MSLGESSNQLQIQVEHLAPNFTSKSAQMIGFFENVRDTDTTRKLPFCSGQNNRHKKGKQQQFCQPPLSLKT